MDLLTFINNGMQNPILDLVVPITIKKRKIKKDTIIMFC